MGRSLNASIIATVLFATGVAWADPPADYPAGTRIFELGGTFQNERHGEDQYFATVVGSAGEYLLDNAAVELQLAGYTGHDKEDSVGIGANVLGRYHFLSIGRVSLYADVLGGIFVMSQDFPTGGTGFNFTYAGGPGLSIQLRDHLYLNGGVRFQHVSNGFIEGRDKNPILNSFGGYVGLMWTR